MSVNAYIESLVKKDMTGVQVSPEKISKVKGELRLYLSEDDKELLRQKAEDLKLTPSEYISYVLSKSTGATVLIQLQDLNGMLDAFDSMAKAVNGMMSFILRGDNNINSTDVEKVIELMESLNRKCNETYVYELQDRKKLYAEAKKKIFSAVKDSSFRK